MTDQKDFEEKPFQGDDSDLEMEADRLAKSASKQKRMLPVLLLGGLLIGLALGAVVWLQPGAPGPETAPAPQEAVKRFVVEPPGPTTPEAAPSVVEPAQDALVAEVVLDPPVVERVTAKPVAAAPVVAAVPPVTAVESEEAVFRPAASGGYGIQVGAFLLPANLQRAEARLRQLGLTGQALATSKPVTMIRLRVGTFPKAQGVAKLKELAELAPDAFLLPQGEELAVYAGSFHDLDGARRFADRLYQQGIHLTEEKTVVPLPLTLLRVEGFADRDAALVAAEKIRATGLDAMVLKHP